MRFPTSSLWLILSLRSPYIYGKFVDIIAIKIRYNTIATLLDLARLKLLRTQHNHTYVPSLDEQ